MSSKLSKLRPNLSQVKRLNSAMDDLVVGEEKEVVEQAPVADNETGSSSEAELNRLLEEEKLAVKRVAKRQRARDRDAIRARIEGLNSKYASLEAPPIVPPIVPPVVNKEMAAATANIQESSQDDAYATSDVDHRATKNLRRTFWVSDRQIPSSSAEVSDGGMKVKDSTGLMSSIIARSKKEFNVQADIALPSDIRVEVGQHSRKILSNRKTNLILENIRVNDHVDSDNPVLHRINHGSNVLQNDPSYRINAAHSIPHCDSDSEGHVNVQRRMDRVPRTATGKDELYDSNARSASSTRSRTKPTKRGKSLTSGIIAKATDTVLYPQDWPHVVLRSDRVGGAYSFHELDVKLFVTGELELISRSFISEMEHDGRLVLLKHLMYLSKVHDWATILKLYTEVVSQIEQGLLTWSSHFDPTITWALSVYGAAKVAEKKAALKVTGGGKSSYKARPNFCKDYQNNTCSFTDSKHWGNVRGERVQVEHICATCLIKRRISVAHSESSLECPSKNSN